MQFVELVVGERLGGEEIEGTRVRVAEQRVQHGQVVAERLAAGRGRHHRDAATVERGFDRVVLVAVKVLDAACW